MGTYSVLLIDSPLTDEQQLVLRQHRRTDYFESNWNRLSKYKAHELGAPLTQADKTFWLLETGVNHGVSHWKFLRSEFVDTIREMVPAAAVYLTTDYPLHEHEWTRAQWLDVAHGRAYVELLTEEAIAEWDLAAANERAEKAVRFLSRRLGTPAEFAAKTGNEWAPLITEVLKALDDAG